MEILITKLKRNSKLNKNLFNSSIRKYVESQGSELAKTDEVQRVSIIIKSENEPSEAGLNIFPVIRRNNRLNSVEMGLSISEHIKKSSLLSSKNNIEIPFDFTKSLTNSFKGKLIKDDESFGYASSRFESVVQTGDNKVKQEECNFLPAISSFHKTQPKNARNCSDYLSKTNSFDAENSELSIIDKRVERFSLKPYVKEGDEGLTGRKGENEDIGLNRKRNLSHGQVTVLDFNEALFRFNEFPVAYTEANLWILGVFERICCFRRSANLNSEFQDLCEKIIIFAYTSFDSGNNFHASLLFTVYNKLKSFSGEENWERSGFISNNPYDNELKNDVANFGLLLIIFLSEFLPNIAEHLLEYCKVMQLAFVSIVFDVAELSIFVLRMRRLNKIMMDCQKCLEILFFFAAGCLAQWFNLHKEGKKNDKIVMLLENRAMNCPKGLINLARDLMSL